MSFGYILIDQYQLKVTKLRTTESKIDQEVYWSVGLLFPAEIILDLLFAATIECRSFSNVLITQRAAQTCDLEPS